MSIDSSWELRCNSRPRSLCVYNAAATSEETNPFEVAAGAENPTAQAVVFGSEKGSLHYRTYSSSQSGSTKTPLGSGRGSNNNNNLPRAYLPVDLPEGSLPGAVVAVVPAVDTPSHRPVFLILIDDNKGNASSAAQPGMYAATLVTLQHGSFSKLSTPTPLPRISSATYHTSCGFVVCTGRRIQCIRQEVFLDVPKSSRRKTTNHKVDFSKVALPPPGSRGGQDALTVIHNGRVAVIAVGNAVLAIPDGATSVSSDIIKIASFSQSSQIHPVLCLDIQDKSMDPDWASLFLANGREACVVDVQLDSSNSSVSCAPPRSGMISLASPILAAATSWPWLTVLTSDGLVSIRSPSCLAIPLKTVEVGTRPNDFFVMRTYREELHKIPTIVCMSYSGDAKTLQCQPDTKQDLADRLMRHSIDAFGSDGFPRQQLAEAVHASFTATSYIGPEPTVHARKLLRQYLEAILGLADFEGGAIPGWPTEWSINKPATNATPHTSAFLTSAFEEASTTATQNHATPLAESAPVVTAETPESLLCGTSLLCLVATLLGPQPKASLANRAAKKCAAQMGVVVNINLKSAAKVNELVAGHLLKEFTQKPNMNLTGSSSQNKVSSNTHMEFVEAATWLLRSCGMHERAIGTLFQHMQRQQSPDRAYPEGGFWPQIKYESYTATHLGELWGTSDDVACQLVLESPATKRLLENNPVLGLNVFTVLHPQNANQWKQLNAADDPLANSKNPAKVIKLLKSIKPTTSYEQSYHDDDDSLPMNTGGALAISFLESAIGINTGRPTEEDEFHSLAPDMSAEARIADFHDELCYLLLEGVLSQRGDDYPPKNEDSTPLGRIYRQRLRKLLRWPLAKVSSERLMSNLPKTFLQEHALVLGRIGRHEDALRILYVECKSMDLALEYCDLRYEQQIARREAERARLAARGILDDQRDDSASKSEDCVYLPLVRVALESDPDKKRGVTAAIQVLALRRGAIDRAAALRLLPKNVPVSAVARPFLIPALVESESQARRLRVVSSLLRARHIALKQQLTDAQLKAQAHLHVVPQLKSLNFGDPLHSTKPLKIKPSISASATFPEVIVIQHFFPRHVVIQAKITNSSGVIDGRALGNVAFVVAESSEEGIQPMQQISIKVLPYGSTGSCWFVLVASPSRMDGNAILTCELRYTVLGVDATTGAPLSFGHGSSGRTFVEELQDLEILPSYFS
ncbi:MAG: hypothetical protein SGBAC_006782 [Bacillariaceae sp.]